MICIWPVDHERLSINMGAALRAAIGPVRRFERCIDISFGSLKRRAQQEGLVSEVCEKGAKHWAAIHNHQKVYSR
jgi:hypothetical protein